MVDIYLAVDFGGSQSKIIYKLAEWDKPKYLLLDPTCVEITKSQFDSYQSRVGWSGNSTPELELWCCYQERVVLLGEYAKAYDSQENLLKLKYEDARWKILGAIGLIAECHKVKISPKKSLKLALAVVLPSDEYSDRKAFEEQLNLMCSGFQVRDSFLKVSIEKFLCRPEGAGLTSMYLSWRGKDYLKSNHFGVLMFGHRNASILVFNRGQKKLSESPHLGFSQFLDVITKSASGLDKERLTKAIYQTITLYNSAKFTSYKKNSNEYHHSKGTHPELFCYVDYPDWIKYKPIQNLVKVGDSQLKEKKIKEISVVINTAIQEYWHKVKNWMSQKLPQDINEVFIGGGASYFLQPLLEEYFNCICRECEIEKYSDGKWLTEHKYICKKYTNSSSDQTTIYWSSRISTQIKKVFDIDNQLDEEHFVTERLVDCSGIYTDLIRSSGE
jgi:hypothetical protein